MKGTEEKRRYGKWKISASFKWIIPVGKIVYSNEIRKLSIYVPVRIKWNSNIFYLILRLLTTADIKKKGKKKGTFIYTPLTLT